MTDTIIPKIQQMLARLEARKKAYLPVDHSGIDAMQQSEYWLSRQGSIYVRVAQAHYGEHPLLVVFSNIECYKPGKGWFTKYAWHPVEQFLSECGGGTIIFENVLGEQLLKTLRKHGYQEQPTEIGLPSYFKTYDLAVDTKLPIENFIYTGYKL